MSSMGLLYPGPIIRRIPVLCHYELITYCLYQQKRTNKLEFIFCLPLIFSWVVFIISTEWFSLDISSCKLQSINYIYGGKWVKVGHVLPIITAYRKWKKKKLWRKALLIVHIQQGWYRKNNFKHQKISGEMLKCFHIYHLEHEICVFKFR